MNLTQAETEIYKRIGLFTGVDKANLRIENQPAADGGPFKPPADKPWCKVFVQYGDSRIVGMGEKPCKRNYGIISIQCFAPRNSGTSAMAALCDAWDAHLQSFQSSQLEVYLVHAPQSMEDDDFYAKLIRAEFRVN